MVRGTFANVRLKNLLAPGTEGGVTRHLPDGAPMSIFDASEKYAAEGVPLRDPGRQGVRHRLVARLGGEGAAPARRARRDRRELRAHPPQQPGRHGRSCRCSSRPGESAASLGPDRRGDLRDRRAAGAAATAASRGGRELDRAGHRRRRQGQGAPARRCASTRRRRSPTTSTAASCTTCCASSRRASSTRGSLQPFALAPRSGERVRVRGPRPVRLAIRLTGQRRHRLSAALIPLIVRLPTVRRPTDFIDPPMLAEKLGLREAAAESKVSRTTHGSNTRILPRCASGRVWPPWPSRRTGVALGCRTDARTDPATGALVRSSTRVGPHLPRATLPSGS